MKDEPGYRQACAELLARALPKTEGDAAFRIAWSCVLMPGTGVDAAQVVRVAEQAVARNAKDPDYLLALGAALYRAGRFEDAAKTLSDAEAAYRREEAAPTPGIVVTTTAIYSQLFLSMTHQRLEHHDEAARWLQQATRSMEQVPPSIQSAASRSWSRNLTLQVLRQQAEATAHHDAR
jgi:tetratricopeptide (TPR) repeat protein